MKKIIILLSIILLSGIIFASKTYAALNCNVNLSKSKDKFTYKEKFSIYASISNLQTRKGIIAIGAVLSYDTNSLTLVDIEGENKWSDPYHNSSNGKITSFKNKLSTSNENVFKITFEVNEKGKASNSAWIKIDNFEISDGDEEKNCGGSSINIEIEEQNSGNSGDSNQGENDQNSNAGNNQSGSNQGDNTGNNQSGSSSGNNNQGTTGTKKPSTGNTTKKPSSNYTNKNEENTDKEETPNNSNEQTNMVENVITEEPVNESNIIQNNLEEDNKKQEETKKDNKAQFYIVSIITIAIIIVILLLLQKYWKKNNT